MILADADDWKWIEKGGLLAAAVVVIKVGDFLWPKVKEWWATRRGNRLEDRQKARAEKKEDEKAEEDKQAAIDSPLIERLKYVAKENEDARKTAATEREQMRKEFETFRQTALARYNEYERRFDKVVLQNEQLIAYVEHITGLLRDAKVPFPPLPAAARMVPGGSDLHVALSPEMENRA